MHYQGVLFYVNVDRVMQPELPGLFIEIKSRTWSASDAEDKADRIQKMLGHSWASARTKLFSSDYLEMQNV